VFAGLPSRCPWNIKSSPTSLTDARTTWGTATLAAGKPSPHHHNHPMLLCVWEGGACGTRPPPTPPGGCGRHPPRRAQGGGREGERDRSGTDTCTRALFCARGSSGFASCVHMLLVWLCFLCGYALFVRVSCVPTLLACLRFLDKDNNQHVQQT
jgi:hypothetical protein